MHAQFAQFYSEFLEHTNYTFHSNGTLTYFPKRTVKFIPERSIGDPTVDIVTVPNVPYLGASSAAAEMSVFAGTLFDGKFQTSEINIFCCFTRCSTSP